MSLRPEIFGVDVKEFIRIFLKHDLQTVEESIKRYEERSNFEISREEDRRLIKEVVAEGRQKLLNLESEHPEMLINLLGCQKEIIVTDSNIWKYIHNEYFEKLTDSLNEPLATLFNHLLNGRRLFPDIDDYLTTTEYPYGYWFREEIKVILEDMRRDWSRYEESEGFGKEFKGWLEMISKANKDLFFWQG